MKYDVNNSKRIYNLLVLKGKCLRYSNEHVALTCSIIDLPAYFKATNFFSGISDAIDNLLFFFLNDEVSASLDNRGPLGDIMTYALDNHAKEQDASSLRLAIPDTQELFRDRTDFMIGSNFLDFTVSSFSVFEKWVSNLYVEIRDRKPSKNKKSKELEKLINRYNESDNSERQTIIKKIMDSCSSYVSSSEKIEFSISMLTNDYERDVKRDRDIIRLYRSQRNTIHNLGVHNHKSIEPISIQGIELGLKEGLPSFTEDFNSDIYICDELVEIYRAMIRDLKPDRIDSFIEWNGI